MSFNLMPNALCPVGGGGGCYETRFLGHFGDLDHGLDLVFLFLFISHISDFL